MSLSSGTITFTGDIADGWGKHHANAKIRSGIHNPTIRTIQTPE